MFMEPDSSGQNHWESSIRQDLFCPFHLCVCVRVFVCPSIHPGHTQLEMDCLPVRACQCETGVFDGLLSAGAESERVYLSWKNKNMFTLRKGTRVDESHLNWEETTEYLKIRDEVSSDYEWHFHWVVHALLGLAVVLDQVDTNWTLSHHMGTRGHSGMLLLLIQIHLFFQHSLLSDQ